MSKRKAPCSNCQNGQRLPEAPLEWEYGGEGTGGVVSTPGWMGALDGAGAVIGWICTQCRREYINPELRRVHLRQRSWRSRTRRFGP
jgi:hypothetical protein